MRLSIEMKIENTIISKVTIIKQIEYRGTSK